MSMRVVKVGGSLFTLPDLAGRLADWFADQPPADQIVLAGGGPLVRPIREAPAQHQLDATTAHWMSVRAMSVTAMWVGAIVPGAAVRDRFEHLVPAGNRAALTVFDSYRFLREQEPSLPGQRLAETWDVTSDSIAARLAIVTSASELVLLKSTLPTPTHGLGQWSRQGIVDPYLPTLAAEMPRLRLVNLRGEGFPEVTIDDPR